MGILFFSLRVCLFEIEIKRKGKSKKLTILSRAKNPSLPKRKVIKLYFFLKRIFEKKLEKERESYPHIDLDITLSKSDIL